MSKAIVGVVGDQVGRAAQERHGRPVTGDDPLQTSAVADRTSEGLGDQLDGPRLATPDVDVSVPVGVGRGEVPRVGGEDDRRAVVADAGTPAVAVPEPSGPT